MPSGKNLPARPSGLLVSLEERWSRSEVDEAAEEEVAYGFQNSHNLAMALNGCVVPDLWFIREGRTALVQCKGRLRRCSHGQETRTLDELGNFLFERLSQLSDPQDDHESDDGREAAFDIHTSGTFQR